MTVRRLKLIDDAPKSAPPAKPDGALRIAIATQDMNNLNAHFGSAKKFAVYDVLPDSSVFVEAIGFDEVSDQSGKHKEDGDDRITSKVAALEGVNLLFVQAIGGPAAAKVVKARIHPVKVAEPSPIEDVIVRVQGMLKSSPPPWLRKVLAAATGRDITPDFAEEDA
jgi:nitrogen fixation protein NifX